MNNIDSLSYRRTDLACETDIDRAHAEGVYFYEYERYGVGVSKMTIEPGRGEELTSRAAGVYVTVTAERPWMWDDDRRGGLVDTLAELLSDAILSSSGKRPDIDYPILICGLGNRAMTADAIGPKTADAVTVTARLREERPELYEKLGCCRVSAISPGVAAATGIEAAEIVRGVAANTSPAVIVLIDALAARSCARLASTIQISDTGISPGSGIGNRRAAITRSTVGVPVVTIGVPTVVSSATLVWDALETAGIEPDTMPDSLRDVLDSGKSFFVTPNESDVVTEEMARLIAEAINRMCRVG